MNDDYDNIISQILEDNRKLLELKLSLDISKDNEQLIIETKKDMKKRIKQVLQSA
jgi:hypothetical protein